MREEANIVEQYADADTSGRIDILIKYYPNFLRLVEGYKQSLSYIIMQECKCQAKFYIVGVRTKSWTKTWSITGGGQAHVFLRRTIEGCSALHPV